MLRNDGNYFIYIIKHLYKRKIRGRWANSGDCAQWLAGKAMSIPFLKYNEFYKSYKHTFNPLTASGECWQETGVHGTYIRKEAIDVFSLVSEWFPEHKFKICSVLIKQKTKNIMISA